jgi:Flp pilus assembly protein TadD
VLAVVLAVCLLGACGDDRDPKGAQRMVDLGLKAHVDGRLGTAETYYRKAIDLDDKNKLAYYNLGLVEQSLGNDVEAETAYRVVLKLDADYEPALFNLAILRTKDSDFDGAESLYRRALAAKPGGAAAHLNLGLLLKQTGRSAEGDAEIAKAVSLDPSLAGRASGSAPTSPPG